ncbi:MAG: recombination mediator RecR [Candidatus Eremiobacteraeota bacterium]|nr:recombination mediator RecR [Candidatus Eremiobacteraeota bacterium]MCW5866515.1 recombination mediator RecR [Candidatus Eremiobacteraeota bacterium]
MDYPEALEELVESLQQLPTIGPKSAQRLAFWLLETAEPKALRLSEAIRSARNQIRPCRRCFNYSDRELCQICADPQRKTGVVCVVVQPKDIVALEKTREYRGGYHVLGGLLSPLDGIGPDQVRIHELLERVREEAIDEVILALDTTVGGEATCLYLSRQLGPETSVTRLAQGLPAGGNLDYTDEVTLGRALRGRRRVEDLSPQ